MKHTETRLRRDLPALADHLTGTTHDAVVAPTDAPRRRPVLVAVFAGIAVLGAVGFWLGQRDDADVDVRPALEDPAPVSTTPVPVPDGPGTWTAMADAPLESRHFAATVWSDEPGISEMWVWAGSSLNRGSAYTDGAAYDPVTDTWRELPVPGWGHPGAVGAYFDGRLAVAAKGGISLVSLGHLGTSRDLPPVDVLEPVDIAVVDGVLHAFGPTDVGGSLGSARWDPELDAWVAGPVASGDFATRVAAAPGYGAVVDEDRALLWSEAGEAALFDPAAGTLVVLPALAATPFTTTGPLVTDAGFVVVAQVDGAPILATLIDDEWQAREITLPDLDLTSTTTFGAGEWVMLFPGDGFPLSIHQPSGTIVVHDQGPLGAMTAPNGIWTGEQLLLWGGASRPIGAVTDPAVGAVWTPPAPATADAPPVGAVMVRIIEPITRNAAGELEACGPQPCFGIPIAAGGAVDVTASPEFALGAVEGWYDGVALLPTTPIAEYTGDLGVLADQPDLPSLCPDIRGPGQEGQMEMRPALRAYTDTVPDLFAASWNDQSTGAQTLWFVGDDIAAHEAAVAEIAGDTQVCVAGGARWSEAELAAVREEIRSTLVGESTESWTHEQRLIVDVPVLDAATRAYLENLHPSVTISPPRIETLDGTAADVPAQQPVRPGDVELLTHARRGRVISSMGALFRWTVSFDVALECFHAAEGEDVGERGVVMLPAGFSADATTRTIFDSDGAVWATEGDTIEIGGGWVGIETITQLENIDPPAQPCGATSMFVT